jgi:MFS family permease
LRDALAPLREREFRLLFTGETVSFLGTAMAPVALAFAVLELTGSKTDLGLVLAARSVPQVIFLLVGGVWADRLPRNHVMVASNLLSGVAQAAVAALLLSGAAEVWHLAALAALNGFASAFFFPAAQGAVPQTVPAASLQSANSLLGLARNATYITGAALGGLIVAATSPGTAIAVDAASYGLAALALAAMRLPPGLRQAGSGFLAELAEGWQEFRSRTWLWAIVLQFAFVNAAWVGAESVLGPVVADEELGGAAVWGLILATQSAGLVVGGLVLLRLRPRRLLLSATIGVLMTLPVLVALAIPMSVVAIAACAFAAGLGLELFGVLWNTTMQQEIPADRLSRVYSYDALGSFVLIPIGFAVVGPVANALGTTETLLLAATLNLLATLAVLASRDVRTLQRRLPPAEATAA